MLFEGALTLTNTLGFLCNLSSAQDFLYMVDRFDNRDLASGFGTISLFVFFVDFASLIRGLRSQTRMITGSVFREVLDKSTMYDKTTLAINL